MRGALVGVMYAMGLVATVAWVLTATQAHAVKLERLTIAVAPLGWDTNFTWLSSKAHIGFQGRHWPILV